MKQKPATRMRVELANGREVLSCHSVDDLQFELGGYSTCGSFRTLPLGIYDGILGMDWLIANNASIHCKGGSVTFTDKFGNVVLIQGKNGKPKARL